METKTSFESQKVLILTVNEILSLIQTMQESYPLKLAQNKSAEFDMSVRSAFRKLSDALQ